MNLFSLMMKVLHAARLQGSNTHQEYYDATVALAEKLDVPVSKLRTCVNQRNRANPEVSTVSVHFRVALILPFLDHLTAMLMYFASFQQSWLE